LAFVVSPVRYRFALLNRRAISPTNRRLTLVSEHPEIIASSRDQRARNGAGRGKGENEELRGNFVEATVPTICASHLLSASISSLRVSSELIFGRDPIIRAIPVRETCRFSISEIPTSLR
jgi:hypothetical protein